MMNTTLKEIWKEIPSLLGLTSKKYAISNIGRVASFTNNIKDKYILKTHLNSGFPVISLTVSGKSKAVFIHHLVAEVFLKKRNHLCSNVIHLNHQKADNRTVNLKWVTKKEKIEHSKKNPTIIKAIANKIYTGAMAKKLDEKTVIKLKKEIWSPNRKLTFKQLAEKYGIAEMNLYRIKSGEMWFHIHVEGEPIFPKYKKQLENIKQQELSSLKENNHINAKKPLNTKSKVEQKQNEIKSNSKPKKKKNIKNNSIDAPELTKKEKKKLKKLKKKEKKKYKKEKKNKLKLAEF
jgi:hypothetical protein